MRFLFDACFRSYPVLCDESAIAAYNKTSLMTIDNLEGRLLDDLHAEDLLHNTSRKKWSVCAVDP